jgi:hypothetical protein
MKAGDAVVVAVGAACIVVLAWRIPDFRRSGTHASEVSELLGRPVPKDFLAAAGTGRPGEGAAIYYVYSETCPWCGMDRTQVRRAALAVRRDGAAVPFVAVSLGKSGNLERYWRELADLPLPDLLTTIGTDAAEGAGIDGVPVLVVARDGVVKAAWIGHLQWKEVDTRRAMECRLGQARACTALFLTDLARGTRRAVVRRA